MPLPRTRTMGMQDILLSIRIPSIADATTRRLVTPISGYIERVIAVRGSAIDAPEPLFIAALEGINAVIMPTGGAAGDVDTFELGEITTSVVAAGELIVVFNTGDPIETTPLNVYLVIRRL